MKRPDRDRGNTTARLIGLIFETTEYFSYKKGSSNHSWKIHIMKIFRMNFKFFFLCRESDTKVWVCRVTSTRPALRTTPISFLLSLFLLKREQEAKT